MNFLGYNFSKNKPTTVSTEVKATDDTVMKMISMARVELPQISESRNNKWMSFGASNDYPQMLLQALGTSSIHNAIVNSKSKMMAGADILFNGVKYEDYIKTLDPKSQEYISMFYNDPSGNGILTLNDLASRISLDWQIFGAYAIELIWSMDFTRIVEVKHIDVSRIRIAPSVDGKLTHYYYKNDWTDKRKNDEIAISAFSEENKSDYNQLIYVRNYHPGMDYYGIPNYAPALGWIEIDSKMGEFHLSNINNGFSPGMTVKFFQKPTPEKKDEVVRDIKNQFAGARNAGKVMIFFTDGKDNAPEITPIDVPGLDQQFLVLGDNVVQQILSGHNVTSPMLLGVPTPGKLGYSNELSTSYNIFQKDVIIPDQNLMLRTLNKIAKINKYDVTLSIEQLLTPEDLSTDGGATFNITKA